MEHGAAIISDNPSGHCHGRSPCVSPGRILHILRMGEYTIMHLRDATDRLMNSERSKSVAFICLLSHA